MLESRRTRESANGRQNPFCIPDGVGYGARETGKIIFAGLKKEKLWGNSSSKTAHNIIQSAVRQAVKEAKGGAKK